MTLSEYIKSLSADDLNDLARRCQTTAGQLKQIGYGNRRCRESLAINLERETNRAVTCEDLRPDVDWAYIRSSADKAEAAA